MKISIIIPVYNTDHEYLAECLESCLHQSVAETVEVITVNDGSTNGCEKVLEEYEGIYDALRVIHQTNQGTSVARNTGLDAARGDYIMFVDADDWLEPNACEEALRATFTANADILFFGYATNYTNRQMDRVLEDPDERIFNRETLQLAILEGNPELGPVEVGAPWGKLIRRSVIEDYHVRYTPGLKKGQDTVFILHLLEKCTSFAYSSFLGYHYRMSGTSISHRYNPDIVGIMERTLSAYRQFNEKYNKSIPFKLAVSRKYFRVLTGEYLMLNYCHHDNKLSEKDKKAEFLELLECEPYCYVAKDTEGAKLSAYDRLMLFFVKHKNVGMLFFVKKIEILLRSIVIRQFRK